MSEGPVLPLPIRKDAFVDITLKQGNKYVHTTQPVQGRVFLVITDDPSKEAEIKMAGGGTAMARVNPEPAVFVTGYPAGEHMRLYNDAGEDLAEAADGFSTLTLKGTDLKLYFPPEVDVSPELVNFKDYPVGEERQEIKKHSWTRFVLMPHRFSCPNSNMGLMNVYLDEEKNELRYMWIVQTADGRLKTDDLGQQMKTPEGIQIYGMDPYYFANLDNWNPQAVVDHACWTFEDNGKILSGAIDPGATTYQSAREIGVIEEQYPLGLVNPTSGYPPSWECLDEKCLPTVNPDAPVQPVFQLTEKAPAPIQHSDVKAAGEPNYALIGGGVAVGVLLIGLLAAR